MCVYNECIDMGSGSSRIENSATPLGCMLQNFSNFKSDYRVKMAKDELIKFCQLEWPTFGVGWPDTGSFDVNLVSLTHSIVTRDGQWDHFPYIDCWLFHVQDRPKWILKCSMGVCKVMAAKAKTLRGKSPEILAPSSDEEFESYGKKRKPPSSSGGSSPIRENENCSSPATSGGNSNSEIISELTSENLPPPYQTPAGPGFTSAPPCKG